MRRCLVILLLFFFCSSTLSSAADKGISLSAKQGKNPSERKRLALVIGNSAYQFSGGLANPSRDAELIAKTLLDVGFDLHGGGAQLDLNRRSLDQAIESFGDSIQPGDVALFYYSGHGLQVAGENYLVPVDANIKKESEVRVKTVPVNLLFAKLDGIPKAVNIVVLDACRNNPFARSFRSSGGGLASVSAPTGTLVAFSTAPGQVAEDGKGNNSTYTSALAKYVKEPGLSIEGVFKKVRSDVGAATRGHQTPWENTSLTGNFKFIDGDALSLKRAALEAAGEAKSEELKLLLKMEAEAKEAQKREQAEIAKRQAEVEKMDAEIAQMKARIGAGTATGDDSLQNMLAMVRQKKEQAKRLETLKKQRQEEERKRLAEIEALKDQQQQKRTEAFLKDVSAYNEIVNSPYGKEIADAAWQSLASKYTGTETVPKWDLAALQELVIGSSSTFAKRISSGAFGKDIATVKKQGYIQVGVNGGVYGFSMPDARGEWKGLDIDTARAVSAAIFGTASKVKYTPLTIQQRFTALQSGEIDVLIRNIAKTPHRETKMGLRFATPNFYDGQGFMVHKKFGVKTAEELSGATVCVLPGTTTEKNAQDFFRSKKMAWKPVLIESTIELAKTFFSRRCDVLTSDISQLAITRAVSPDPNNYIILPEQLNRQVLAPVVRQGDDLFFNIVDAAVRAMIYAEEQGITSANVDKLKQSNDPKIQKFLGVTPGIGEELGLDDNWAYNIIKQVGNYGEIYDRNVGMNSQLKLERNLNQLSNNGGLMKSLL